MIQSKRNHILVPHLVAFISQNDKNVWFFDCHLLTCSVRNTVLICLMQNIDMCLMYKSHQIARLVSHLINHFSKWMFAVPRRNATKFGSNNKILHIFLYHWVTSDGDIILDSCIITFSLNCSLQLKQFYDKATKVSSRKKCYYFWWSTWLFKGLQLYSVHVDWRPLSFSDASISVKLLSSSRKEILALLSLSYRVFGRLDFSGVLIRNHRLTWILYTTVFLDCLLSLACLLSLSAKLISSFSSALWTFLLFLDFRCGPALVSLRHSCEPTWATGLAWPWGGVDGGWSPVPPGGEDRNLMNVVCTMAANNTTRNTVPSSHT